MINWPHRARKPEILPLVPTFKVACSSYHTARHKSGKIIFLTISLLFNISIGLAIDTWPLSSDWTPVYGADWEPIQDANDQQKGYLDIVTDSQGAGGYFYTNDNTVFFRIALETTPLKSGTNLQPNASWYIALDVDLDNLADWQVRIDGGQSTALHTFYASGLDGNPNIQNYEILNPLNSGDVRLVNGGYSAYPSLTYLDFQVPWTALSSLGYDRNVLAETANKFFYYTSISGSVLDALGPGTDMAVIFSEALVLTFASVGADALGYIYDTRDTQPYSNQGTWLRTETVKVSGSGWPSEGSTYYNNGQRNLKIQNSADSLVWSGTVTTDISGVITAANTWTINQSAARGIYRIYVEDPVNPAVWYGYDTFTVKAPVIAIGKTASADSTISGDSIVYHIAVWNSGDTTGNATTIIDYLPTGFNYIPGTTTGITTNEPAITGQQLSWTGAWPISVAGQPGDTISLSFGAKVSTIRGLYTNDASAGGSNFGFRTVLGTAPVQVLAPRLTLAKSVNANSSQPGDTLTYTVTYTNTGDSPANFIFILENIPPNTTYVTDSASGNNTTITYSHNNGTSYDASQTAPVTNLSFQRTTTLPSAASATVTFKVVIN